MTKQLLLALLLLAPLTSPGAHELEENRLTLVLRDRTHLSLTFYLDYPGVLHRLLAPKSSMQEFLLKYSAVSEAELEMELEGAQRKIRDGTRLIAAGGNEIVATGWSWPSGSAVLAGLRRQVMRGILGGSGHDHDAPTEVRAEAVSARDVTALELNLADELQPILVVSYRPSQLWIRSGTPGKIHF